MREAFGLDRRQTLVLGASALAHAALGFLPLFGGPGYEASLALGLILPLPLAWVSAAQALPMRTGNADPAIRSPIAALTASVQFALLVLAAHTVILLLHGARAGFCDPLQGLIGFALGPALGAIMAAAWGSFAGLLGSHLGRGGRGIALALAAAGPMGGVLVSVWRFWSSPMVFAFDPFAGFFAGPLYDTVIDAVPRLITYRVGSAASLLALTCFCLVARRSEGGRLTLSGFAQRVGCAALGALGAAASIGIYWAGPELGHYQSTSTIRAALGASSTSARCEIVYASGILPERVRLLGEECDAHVAGHEAYFGTRVPERITVFAFASAGQKGELMGASNTYIAKPWRREVYVQNENYPHPVLSHELAHVVTGTFARGPLEVAGPLAGWIPDPGRIEGFAVAAAPPEDSDYTLLEWTKALRDLGLLPPLRAIFRLSFLGENSSTGYTVAGAVVEWLRAEHGAAPLRAWYGGASVEEAFGGKSLAVLEQGFHAALDRLQLPARVLELAKARFDRPAIFGRTCPHVVDHRLEEAAAAFERFDLRSASASYQDSLELDPTNLGARLGLAACDQRRGAEQEAQARYRALSTDESLTRVQRAAVFERLGDRALITRDSASAEAFYAEAERYAFDEHRARTIDVKRYALGDLDALRAIGDLLIGDSLLGVDMVQASAQLGEWSAKNPRLGLADYLIGKNLYTRARWRDAHVFLQRALQRDLPLASVRREALRTAVFGACAIGERQVAADALREYLEDPGLSSARKTGMQRFAKVCRLPAPQ